MKDKNIAALIARKIISRLANLTPGVVYYAKGWPMKINGTLQVIAASRADGQSPLTTASISMACAMHEYLPKVGDKAEISLTGVTRGDSEVGHFVVTVQRRAA